MTTITAIPYRVIAADTNNHELTIDHPSNAAVFKKVVLMIEVLVGSFKFNVGADASNSNDLVSAGEKVMITLEGVQKLNYQGSAINDEFRVSI